MKKVLLILVFGVVILASVSSSAKAYNVGVSGEDLNLQGASHTYIRTQDLFFPRNYDGWDGSQSKIFDNGNMHISTDDYLYLDAPQKVYVKNQAYFVRNYDGWEGTQSAIYDNSNLHIATDDYLFLDAPKLVTIQKDLKVNGDIYTSSGVLSATQLGDNTSSIQELTDEKLSLTGGTMEGTINMNGNEINNAIINSDLIVKGSLYNSTGSIVINDSINQTGNGQVNLTGKFYVDDNIELTGNLSATGALYTTSGALDTTGGTVLHVGEFYANSITLHKPTTVSSNFTVTGGVDFSGASSQKLPVVSTGGSCSIDSDRGKIYYDTDDNHVYVCQKSGITFGWAQLDNVALPN